MSIVWENGRLWFLKKSRLRFGGQRIQGERYVDYFGGTVKSGIVIGDAGRCGVAELLFLMSCVSVQLGIFNLLPIPALDGGHIFMLLIEKINGGPLSIAFRERTQMIGFSVLISLMIFVTWNDVISLL